MARAHGGDPVKERAAAQDAAFVACAVGDVRRYERYLKIEFPSKALDPVLLFEFVDVTKRIERNFHRRCLIPPSTAGRQK
ncbi:MAG: hypothetical protein M3M96_09595 [Candidatus Eremiobacteraeota bacterium]|nr:hypothetical protein [Candidatus Eremiobacteraeota bacterium]